MTTDSARSARPTPRLALATAMVVALGTAGCGGQIAQPIAEDAPSTAPEEPAAAQPVTEEPATARPDHDRTATRRTPEWPDRLASEPPESGGSDETDDSDGTEEKVGDAEEPDLEAALEESDVLEEDDSGEAVEALQVRLRDLGYWLGTVDGVYGDLTEQAVMAFQGWEGLARDGRAGPETLAALDDAAPPAPTSTSDGIEVHLDQQVLLVTDDGRTERALHVSTGSGERYTQPSGDEAVADTPTGSWEVSWRIDGWRQSDLGRLYRPAYFHERGIAVHGYPEVPVEPASHGCVRVSMAAMDMLWAEGHVERGTTVVVS